MNAITSPFSLLLVALALLAVDATHSQALAMERGLLTGKSISVAGVTRQYHLFLPEQAANAPVVLLFHGHSSNYDELLGLAANPAPYKKWLEIAERENLILLVPNGLFSSSNNKGWNDCRADAPTNSTADDVAFVAALLDLVVAQYQADPRRVYAQGTSNGGHFSIRLAQELPERLAAFAAISAANAVNSECTESTLPISALIMNGTADPLLPFGGGQMASARGAVYSNASTVDYWVQRNRLNTTPQFTTLPDINAADGSTVEKRLYRGADSAREVALYTILGGGHTDPSISERYPANLLTVLGKQNADIEMAEAVWSFFRDKTAAQPVGTASAVFFDAASPGDGFYFVKDDRFVSIAYFGYALGGQMLWLVGTRPIADSPMRFGESSVFTLYCGGSNGSFAQAQNPDAVPLPRWGELTLILNCSTDNPSRLSGLATLNGRDGAKQMQLSSLLSAPGVCSVPGGQ